MKCPVQQKLAEHCKSTIIEKMKILKKKKGMKCLMLVLYFLALLWGWGGAQE